MINLGKKNVLGVLVDAVDYECALTRIKRAALAAEPFTVSALAVHGVMTGATSEVQKYRLNKTDLVVPDGQPVRWALNLLYKTGLSDRVYGPELTLRTLAMAEAEGLAVYFYGSTQGILNLLLEQVKLRFPALRVTGCEPSKFRQLEPDEIEALGERIVSSGAQILLAGLGCPRQETFAYEMRSLLPMPVLAVGAAFSFIAGTLSQAPPAMQRFGLEWLYRLKEEPLRLWRRYLLLNPYYVYLVAKQKLGMKFSPAGIKPLTHARFG